MSYQKRALALSYHVKARIHLVYTGFQQPSRDSIRYTRYSSRKDDLWSHTLINFLYRFFQYDLLEDTIDVDITVWTLKGIHIFRKDHSSQSSVCSPWGSLVKPFPSLVKKMEAYIEERWNITNPFSSAQRQIGQFHPPLKKTPPQKGVKLTLKEIKRNFVNPEEWMVDILYLPRQQIECILNHLLCLQCHFYLKKLLQAQISLCSHLTKWCMPN